MTKSSSGSGPNEQGEFDFADTTVCVNCRRPFVHTGKHDVISGNKRIPFCSDSCVNLYYGGRL